MTDKNVLKFLLQNHILKMKVTLSELYNGQTLETVAGKLLRVFIYRTVRTTYLCVYVCLLVEESQTEVLRKEQVNQIDQSPVCQRLYLEV